MTPRSEHFWLELAHVAHAGHEPGDPPPLGPGDPVPGCDCPRCLMLTRGAGPAEADRVVDLVRFLARVDPAARLDVAAAVDATALDVSAGQLCRWAARLPWAVQPTPDPGSRDRDELPVEEARRVPILAVARRLGLGEPEKRGREYVVRCPLHDDNDPSLRLNPEKGAGGVWRCWPCLEGGDGIDLVEAVQSVDFVDAVKWLAGGAGTPTAGPGRRQRTA